MNIPIGKILLRDRIKITTTKMANGINEKKPILAYIARRVFSEINAASWFDKIACAVTNPKRPP